MTSALRSPVLRRFALSQFLLEVQFWFPVWLIFLTGRGFSITTAVMADGVFRLTVVALELPLGILADRIGRRRTYLGVAALTVVSFTAITQVRDVPQLVAAWVVWGVLWALSSGTASAYLYELVTDHTADVSATQAFGALRVVTSAAVLVSHLSAGYLYQLDDQAPFLLTAVMGAAAGAVALSLPEIHGSRRLGSSLRTVAHGLRGAWSRETLRIAAILSVLLLVFGWSVRILFQPLILDLGLTSTTAGVTYFGYSAAAVAAGIWCGAIDGSRRHRLTTAGFVLLSAAVIGTAVLPGLGPFVFIPVMGLGYHLAWTLLDVTVNEQARPAVRATVASGISPIGGLAIAIARPSLGALADRTSAATAFAAWAAVGIAVTAAAAVLARRMAESSREPSQLPGSPGRRQARPS